MNRILFAALMILGLGLFLIATPSASGQSPTARRGNNNSPGQAVRIPQGRRYYNGRYFGNFNNRYYGPQYGYF